MLNRKIGRSLHEKIGAVNENRQLIIVLNFHYKDLPISVWRCYESHLDRPWPLPLVNRDLCFDDNFDNFMNDGR